MINDPANHRSGLARRRLYLSVALVTLLSASTASAQVDPRAAAELVKEGNTLLAEGKPAEALTAYDNARDLLPDSPVVAYNRGLALFRLGRFDKAEPAFQDAMQPGHPELEAMAKYNLGRSVHAAALAKAEDVEATINGLSRAIRFYQDALQIRPDDADAQRNMKLAQRLMGYLKRKLEQQKQEEKKEPTSQPDQQPTSQPDQQPTSQPTSQPQQGDQEQEDQEGNQKEQEGQQQDQEKEGGEGQQKEDQQKDPGDEREGKLSPEEAEKFLQEARDMERKRREAKREEAMRRRGRIRVDKDW